MEQTVVTQPKRLQPKKPRRRITPATVCQAIHDVPYIVAQALIRAVRAVGHCFAWTWDAIASDVRANWRAFCRGRLVTGCRDALRSPALREVHHIMRDHPSIRIITMIAVTAVIFAAAVMAELKNRDREIEELNNKLAQMRVENLIGSAKEICGLKFICAKLEGVNPGSLRIMGDHLKFKAPDAIALLASVNEGKVSVLAVCGLEALKEGAHASKIVKEISSMAGGSGGGRPDSAMGGANPDMIDEALASAAEIVETLLINK